MADHFIGMNRGSHTKKNDAAFTLGTSSGSTDVEVRYGDAIEWTRYELAVALRNIADKLVSKASRDITANKFPKK